VKKLHRDDLYCWSEFNERLNIDFNSIVWVRAQGNVVIDPMPLRPHDLEHLRQLGGARHCLITNADHVRGAAALVQAFGAELAGPSAEASGFPVPCQRWLADGDELVPGLRTFEMQGSKTAGELALVLEGTTLITGDLVRAHRPTSLMLLRPEQGLSDGHAALASLERLLEVSTIEAVLVGDGWLQFREGGRLLRDLVERQRATVLQAPGARQPRSC
jgi:glyoxylase-like metal-dependent hydrolase (beta-lactamase superfamily II)